jgi:hypothetical protein
MSAEWTELFAVFEQSLNEWLARAVEPPSAPPPHPTEPGVLHQFEERLKRLQAYLDKAEQDAEQALAPLTTDIQALQQWLGALKMVQSRLVEQPDVGFPPAGLRRPFAEESKDPAGR